MGDPLSINANVLSNATAWVDDLAENAVVDKVSEKKLTEEKAIETLGGGSLGGLPPFDVLRDAGLVAEIHDEALRMANPNAQAHFAPIDELKRAADDACLRFFADPDDANAENPSVAARQCALAAIKAKLGIQNLDERQLDRLNRVLTAVMTCDRVKAALGESVNGVGKLVAKALTGDSLVEDAATLWRMVVEQGYPDVHVEQLHLLLNHRNVDVRDPKSMLLAADACVSGINRKLEEFGNWKAAFTDKKTRLQRELAELRRDLVGNANAIRDVEQRLADLDIAASRLCAARRRLLGDLSLDLTGKVPKGAEAEDVSLVALANLQDQLKGAETRIAKRNAFYHKIPGLRAFFGSNRVTSTSIRAAVEAEALLRRLLAADDNAADDGVAHDLAADAALRTANDSVRNFLDGQDLEGIGQELSLLRHQLKLTGLASIERNVSKSFSCCLESGRSKPGKYVITTSFFAGAALKLCGLNAKLGYRHEFVSSVVIDDSGRATVTTASRGSFEAAAGWKFAGDTVDFKALASLGFQVGHARRYANVRDMIAANCTAMAVKMNGGRVMLTDKGLRQMAAKANNAGFKRMLRQNGVLSKVDGFTARSTNKRVTDKVNSREYDLRGGATAGVTLPASVGLNSRGEFRAAVTSRQEVRYVPVFEQPEFAADDDGTTWQALCDVTFPPPPPQPPLGGAAPADDDRARFRRVLAGLRECYEDFKAFVAYGQAVKSGLRLVPPALDLIHRNELENLGILEEGEVAADFGERRIGEALRKFAEYVAIAGRKFAALAWSNQPRDRVERLAAERQLERLRADILNPTEFAVSRETLESNLYDKQEGDRRRAIDIHFRANADAEFDVMAHKYGSEGVGKNKIPVVNPKAGAAVEFDVHHPISETLEDRRSFAMTFGFSNFTGIQQIIDFVAGALERERSSLFDNLGGVTATAIKALVAEEIRSALGAGVKVGLTKLDGILPAKTLKPLKAILKGLGGVSERDLLWRIKWINDVDGHLHIDSIAVVHKCTVKAELSVSLADFGIPVYFGASYQNVSEVELTSGIGSQSLYKPLHVRRGPNGKGNLWLAFVHKNRENVRTMFEALRAHHGELLQEGDAPEPESPVARQFRQYVQRRLAGNRNDDLPSVRNRIEELLGAEANGEEELADKFGRLLDILNE